MRRLGRFDRASGSDENIILVPPRRFTLEQAIELVKELNPERAYFTHLSHQLGLHSEIQKELPPNIKLSFDGLKIVC